MLSVRRIALHSTYLNLINKTSLWSSRIGYIFREVGKQCSIRLLSKNTKKHTNIFKKKKTIAIIKHPETLMQSFPLFFDCLLMKLYITPFCPKTFAEVCSKESERNCVDGWSSSLTSVLQYTCLFSQKTSLLKK